MEPRSHVLKDGSTLVIREAVVEDARELVDYVELICRESDFLSLGPGDFNVTVAQEESILRTFHQTDNQIYFVGLVDGVIVAMLAFVGGPRPRTRHAGELSMSVLKEFWGRGIGSCLLDELFEWARGTGIVTKVDLRVRSDHERAIALYGRKGFVVEGTLRNEIRVEGKYHDHLFMGRDV